MSNLIVYMVYTVYTVYIVYIVYMEFVTFCLANTAMLLAPMGKDGV